MSRFKTMPLAVAAGMAILAATACSNEEPAAPATPAPPAARSELEAAAALVPHLDEAVLRNTADYCSRHAPRTRAAVEAAWAGWQARNAAHMAVSRQYRARLEASAAHGSTEEERRASQELLTQNAMLIDSFTNQQLDVMRVALEHGERQVIAELCTEQFAKVAAGEWDIRQRDPEIAALLDAGAPADSTRP